MSRGHGKLQRQILEAVAAATEPVQRNRLAWTLAEQIGAIKVTKPKKLSRSAPVDAWTRLEASFERSFQRALAKCSERHLKVKSLKFDSLTDLIEHYPYKTNRQEVRDIRIRLLPHLEEFCGTKRGWKFTATDTENHILELRRESNLVELQRLSQEWERIEWKLLGLIASPVSAQSNDRDDWMEIHSRGRQLFLDAKLSHSTSLGILLGRLEGHVAPDTAAHALFTHIVDFYWRAFPKETLGRANLKSQIYSVVDVKEGTRPYLKDDFKAFLRGKELTFIQALTGHKEQTGGKNSWSFVGEKTSYSPLLDYLIDRYAFSQFQFLSIPTAATRLGAATSASEGTSCQQ